MTLRSPPRVVLKTSNSKQPHEITCNPSSATLWVSKTEVSGRCQVADTLENQVVLKDFLFLFSGQSSVA